MTLPDTLHIPAFQSFTLAILLFLAGLKVAEHWSRAFMVVPLACGFLVDIVNALIIQVLV